MGTPLAVQFSWSQLQQNYCFTTPQAFMNDILSLLSGVVAGGGAGLIIGPNLPSPSDQNKLWARTDANGYLEGTYLYLGVWARPHPIAPSSQEMKMWKGSLAQLYFYDGGDGTDPTAVPPTDTSGAMWQEDTTMRFALPMGVGTNGTAYPPNPATSIVAGQALGQERHVLGLTEIPAHAHGINTLQTNAAGGSGIFVDVDLTAGAPGASTALAGGSLSHENLPPVIGTYFIRRTARRFITV